MGHRSFHLSSSHTHSHTAPICSPPLTWGCHRPHRSPDLKPSSVGESHLPIVRHSGRLVSVMSIQGFVLYIPLFFFSIFCTFSWPSALFHSGVSVLRGVPRTHECDTAPRGGTGGKGVRREPSFRPVRWWLVVGVARQKCESPAAVSLQTVFF